MMKLAIVYDRVNKIGGAERVLQALHEIYPDAPLYTSVYDSQGALWAKDYHVVPSFLQKVPFLTKHHELLFWLMPFAFESFDFSQFDVVISVTSEYAKSIITQPNTLHLCYCLTPTRYLWSGQVNYISSSFLRWLAKPLVRCFQNYDKIISQRPDEIVAISDTVRNRITRYYGRESKVIYPPVDTTKFKYQISKHEKNSNVQNSNAVLPGYRSLITSYYLVVSRLVKYKKVDLVVKTFNELGWNLVIIGTGAEEQKLKSIAKPNITFLGQLTDERIVSYYQKCRAVIFPTEEDFGIVPLEAQACGKPVIAFRKGGVTETVVEGKTGEFFNQQTVESLTNVLQDFNPKKYNPADCRNQAVKFCKERFKEEFKDIVNKLITKHK